MNAPAHDFPHLSGNQIAMLTGRIMGRPSARPATKGAAAARLAQAIGARASRTVAEKTLRDLQDIGHFGGAEEIVAKFMAKVAAEDGGETKAAPKKLAAKEASKAPTKKAPASPKAEANGAEGEEAGRRGRKSVLLGKRLVAKVAENPRRQGSHGFRSIQLILDAGPKGIATESFIELGGRLKDAQWDIAHNYVEAR
jgi:hypothetical protein